MAKSPSPQHEALHRVFSVRKGLLSRVLPGTAELAEGDVDELSTDYNVTPEILVRHGDTALVTELYVHGPGGQCTVVIEAQTSDIDAEVRYRWAYYAAFLLAKYQRPVVFAVTTNDVAIARAARVPIQVGPPHWPLAEYQITAFGPDTEPEITDVATAEKNIDAAIFAALVHGKSKRIDVILEVLHVALASVDPKTITGLIDFIEMGLGDTGARLKWRQLMRTSNFPYVSEVRQEGIEMGREEGIEMGREERRERDAKRVERVLDQRGIAMTDADRKQIVSCRDEGTLNDWLDRMVTVVTVVELFAGETEE
jgi:hypothetical protein